MFWIVLGLLMISFTITGCLEEAQKLTDNEEDSLRGNCSPDYNEDETGYGRYNPLTIAAEQHYLRLTGKASDKLLLKFKPIS